MNYYMGGNFKPEDLFCLSKNSPWVWLGLIFLCFPSTCSYRISGSKIVPWTCWIAFLSPLTKFFLKYGDDLNFLFHLGEYVVSRLPINWASLRGTLGMFLYETTSFLPDSSVYSVFACPQNFILFTNWVNPSDLISTFPLVLWVDSYFSSWIVSFASDISLIHCWL